MCDDELYENLNPKMIQILEKYEEFKIKHNNVEYELYIEAIGYLEHHDENSEWYYYGLFQIYPSEHEILQGNIYIKKDSDVLKVDYDDSCDKYLFTKYYTILDDRFVPHNEQSIS